MNEEGNGVAEQPQPARGVVVSCPLCRYYSPDLVNPQGLGVCRRRPPVVFPMPNGASLTCWPMVKKSDWCGDGAPGISADSVALGQAFLDKSGGKR